MDLWKIEQKKECLLNWEKWSSKKVDFQKPCTLLEIQQIPKHHWRMLIADCSKKKKKADCSFKGSLEESVVNYKNAS